MSTSSTSSRSRWTLPFRRSRWEAARETLSQSSFWLRAAICLVATLILYIVSGAWGPAFPYRIRQNTLRDLSARVAFEFEDLDATQEARARARSSIICFYEHDPRPLPELRQALIESLFQLKEKPAEEVVATLWPAFFPSGPPSPETPSPATLESLTSFRTAIEADSSLDALRSVLDRAFLEFDQTGLLENLEHELGQGSLREIQVYPRGNRDDAVRVDISRVRIAEIADRLRRSLQDELERDRVSVRDPELVAERLFSWLRPRLPVTLKFDADATRRAAVAAADQVPIKTRRYEVGDPLQRSVLDPQRRNTLGGGAPLDHADMRLLLAEHQALLAQLTWPKRLLRSTIFCLFVLAALALLSTYLWQRHRPLVDHWQRYLALIGAFVGSYALAWLLAENREARLEIIPLVLCAMAIAIAYHIELAVLLCSLVAVVFTLAHGYPFSEFIVLAAGVFTAAMFCRSIRNRNKSVLIGIVTGLVVFPVVLGVQLLVGYPFRSELVVDALWFAGAAGGAGLIMTTILPSLERWFDLPTDISLLELSDPNHALLKQLIQRAPGTYNHSINVASMAEAAADAIGANGLLCRVGAYFHDIGKMRKPEYFVENQSGGVNKHDDLVPTMSTLVIISHVKDGVDMARSHQLPRRIIDLIEQHHGTTVVEFFYRRAVSSNAGEDGLTEADFRYPGPKPQTPEAAVLMIADAVEGACRTLREPAPSRIEAVVRDITKKRLDDGQFDECPITIQQIHIVQESLTKSLNAMYHARVKYSEQQFA